MKTGKIVLLAALVLFFGAYYASAATIIVNPGPGTPIQDAINAAPNGSTIKIKAGTYFEEIMIACKSRLKLIGAGAGKTIIDGSGGAGNVVKISDSKKIILQQCTIRNGVSDNVYIDKSHRVKILRNEIKNAANAGIFYGQGTNLVIQGNQIKTNGTYGIGFVADSYRNLIVKNTITGNGSGGIYHIAGNGDKIIKNTVHDNTGGGIVIMSGSVKTQRNTVTNNSGFGIYEIFGSAQQNVYTKNTVQGNVAGGIHVGAGAMVTKNTVTDNTGNGIEGALFGNTLIGNLIKDNTGYGIYLVADGHYLKGNLVTGNGGMGIYIDATNGGTLTVTGMSQVLKNKVLNNGGGLGLDSCNLTIVSNNFCAGIPGWGIWGGTGSMAVLYTKNKVFNNLAGLAMTVNGGLDYIARNIVVNNLMIGVYANGGQMMTFEKNVITGNGAGFAGPGLSGFKASLVSRNKILNNGGNGIDASTGAASLIEKNVVKGNGDGTTTFDLYDSVSPTDDWWQKNQYITESL